MFHVEPQQNPKQKWKAVNCIHARSAEIRIYLLGKSKTSEDFANGATDAARSDLQAILWKKLMSNGTV